MTRSGAGEGRAACTTLTRVASAPRPLPRRAGEVDYELPASTATATAWSPTATVTSTSRAKKSFGLPMKPPDTGAAWSGVRATETRIRLRPAIRPLVGIELHPAGTRQIDRTPGMRRTAAHHRIGAVDQRGIIDVPADEPRREAQRTRRLHHQQREIAAGAAARGQGHQRRVGALGVARLVGEVGLDRLGHRRQHRQRLGVAVAGQKASRPGVQLTLRIGRLALHQARQVRHLLDRVAERVDLGDRIERQVGLRRVMLQVQRRDDAQRVGPRPGEIDEADRVAEHVVRPAQLRRRRRDPQRGVVQAQVVAVVRAQHQPVLGQAHRRGVAIGRGVLDADAHAVISDQRSGKEEQASATNDHAA